MRRIVLLAAVPAAILLSCSREDGALFVAVLPAGESGPRSGRLISFSAGDEDTRDVTSGIALSSFGVFAVGSSSGDEVMYDQMVRRGKQGYTYSPPKYFPEEGLDFMAYAPYGSSSVSFQEGAGLVTDFDISLPESLSEDVLLAGPLRGVRSSPVLLSFIHPLTSISVEFAFSPHSILIPAGKGARVTSLSLSHCIREGSYDAESGTWTSKGEFCPAGRSVSALAQGRNPVNVGALYSIPFTAPSGTMLEIDWEAFNLDSGAAIGSYSIAVDLSGRDFAASTNITVRAGAMWYD
ncbi:MAG: fimbrillin family protein [Bacteroidales bacterium]|nr:fimbrillin family protein [Bacteroidales bacterium]